MKRFTLSSHAKPHVISYLWIRRAVGGLGLALPVILGPIGYLVFDIEIQENMSCYYHTPLRDVFVGILCSIGLFMFCYVGCSPFENWTGNIGCVAAIGVAWLPIEMNSDPMYQSTVIGYLHTMFGGVLFGCMGMFSLFHFPANEPEDENRQWDRSRKLIFRTTGFVLFGSLVAMAFYLFVLSRSTREQLAGWNIIFWGEWIALWAFAIAWLVKGRTLGLLMEGVDVVKSLKPKP